MTSPSMSRPLLTNAVFILVRPESPGNIGASARVLKNFGLRELRLVNPPRQYRDFEDKWMAVGAFDLLEASQSFDSLERALEDVSLAVATSSGRARGTVPEEPGLVLPEAVETLVGNKVGFVFGNEKNGLQAQELDRCHRCISIPCDPDFPVLNLSQAVGIIAYELSRHAGAWHASSLPSTTNYSDGQRDDAVFALLDELLHKAEFTRSYNHDLVIRELRQAYQRMRPSDREARLLKGTLHKLLLRLSEGPPSRE